MALEAPQGYTSEDAGIVASIRSSGENAAQYLRDRWDEFVGLQGHIVDLQHRAAVLAAEARERGDTATYDRARASIGVLGDLNVRHGQAVDHMREVASFVGVTGLGSYEGLGAIPVAMIGAVTALALVVVWFFRAAELEERKLDLLEGGTVTVEELRMLDPGPAPAMVLGQAAGLAKVLVAGLVIWVGFQLVQGAGGLKKLGFGRRRSKKNPPLIVWDSNPPGNVIGRETAAVYYEHAQDGQPYVHEFGPDVELLAEPDGTIRMEHRGGKELWGEFDDPDDEENPDADDDELEDDEEWDDDDEELDE